MPKRSWPADGFDHDAATRELLSIGTRLIGGAQVIGIGHRVVHGGMKYAAPIRVDRHVLAELSQLIPLAPLHQPHNLAPIRTILDASPAHAAGRLLRHRVPSQPGACRAGVRPAATADRRRRAALRLSRPVVRIPGRRNCATASPELASGRVIIAHLGNGASLCAIEAGAASPARWASPRSTA